MQNKDRLLSEAQDEMEQDLVLLGATCVEDRLQDRVPETIADLQRAGVKVWMLTGDKLETAENIGYSCRLLTKQMEILKCSHPYDVYHNFSDAKVKENELKIQQHIKTALLIEDKALKYILADDTL